jgi:tetratricopeptide (TPR) repeat protein
MKNTQEHYRHIYTKIEVVLKTEEWRAEGRLSGMKFALLHQNDVDQIQADIQDWEERIAQASDGNPLAVSTSTRIYRDSYLQALRESLELINKLDYTAAIKQHPQDAEVYFNRGFAYFKAGRMTEAIDDYTEAIRLDSHSHRFIFIEKLHMLEPKSLIEPFKTILKAFASTQMTQMPIIIEVLRTCMLTIWMRLFRIIQNPLICDLTITHSM